LKKKVHIIFLFVVITGLFACKKDTITIPYQNNGWTRMLPDRNWIGENNYVSGKVEQNELRLLNLTDFLVIDGDGQLYENIGIILRYC